MLKTIAAHSIDFVRQVQIVIFKGIKRGRRSFNMYNIHYIECQAYVSIITHFNATKISNLSFYSTSSPHAFLLDNLLILCSLH